MPDDELDLPALSMISPDHFVGWLFSNRPEPAYPTIYRKFLSLKYFAVRGIRKATQFSLWLHSCGTGIRDSFLFKGVDIGGRGGGGGRRAKAAGAESGPAKSVKRDKVMWKSTLRVGEVRAGKGEDGSGFYWKYALVDRPAPYFERLQLPPESGSCVAVDLTVRRDADDGAVKRTANYMKKFLSHHFSAELSASEQFKGIFVFPTVNEGDGSRVIRCALCYKRAASVDMFLEHLHMDCTLGDIVTIFTGGLFANVHIAEMVESAKAAIDAKVTGRDVT
jgi:hypothetical protein